MPAECSTCAHPRLADIHRSLDGGGGVNATARAFDIKPSTLKLHIAKHRGALPPVAAAAAKVVPEIERIASSIA